MTIEHPLVTHLRAPDGGEVTVSTDPADFDRHASDFTPARARVTVIGVAYPRSTEEVSAVMKAASAAGVPVVTQGGLTGMTGGAVPTAGCLIVSLERMRRILEIDEAASVIVVEAGVPLQAVQEAAAEADLLFPLDLGARGSCTIGGNLATNAGGNRVLRYGMARDLVLGIEVVLADGTIVTSLSRMIKNNAGYDLRHIFIGSEGTLGVITRAVLRLFPRATTANAALCAVPDFDRLLGFLRHARATAGSLLSAFEVMWNDFYEIASAGAGVRPLAPAEGGLFVLLDMLGNTPDQDNAMFGALIEQAFENGLITDAVIAQSQTQIEDLWRIRDTSGELGQIWGRCINFDISVPISAVGDFVATCRSRLAAELPGHTPLFFGHIADSNIHVACLDDQPVSRQRDIERIVYETVSALHGSVSAEHGIGLDKREYLPLTRNAAEIDVMRRVKAALDPAGLLNPGKVL